MHNFYGNVSDLLVFGILAAVVVLMIIIAEIMRATARYCDPQEASNRLRVSIGLFRTALILLLMYGANQTLETHQLKAIVRSHVIPDGTKMADVSIPEVQYDVVLSSGTKISWSVVDERKRRRSMSGAEKRSITIDGSRSTSGFTVDGSARSGADGLRDGKLDGYDF